MEEVGGVQEVGATMVVRVGQAVGRDVGPQQLSVELQSRRLEVSETRAAIIHQDPNFQVPAVEDLDPRELLRPHPELLRSQLGREQPLPYLARP
jgi:hypothetical protein